MTSLNAVSENTSQKILAAQTVCGVAPEDYPVAFPSIGALLEERSTAQATATFLVYYDEENHRAEFSYRDFIANIRRTAALMHSLGIRRGDRIATAAHNHPDTIVHYFAAWMLGVCVVPLNMSEDNQRLHYILSNAGVKTVFCQDEYLNRVQEIKNEVNIEANIEANTVVQMTNAPMTDDQWQMTNAPTTNDLNLDALIVYTSGTTGNPKGVVLTQRNILADSDAIKRWHGITPETRLMCVLPVHHVNGTIVTHTTPMLAGASVVLNRKFQTEYFFERVKREGVHIVSVVPTLLAFLLEANADTLCVEREQFRYLICGAGPLTCELARNFEERFALKILHGYGLSETTCYSCYLPTDLSPESHKHWMMDYGFPSIGVPLDVNEMAIHDERGNALGETERGEIVIRGANVMREYYQNPEANAKTFEFGWFRSGDEGFFKRDDKGRPFFFITGRLKELIIRGGVNLAPLEIDEVLASAPSVKAAICVGFENDFYGEEVGALVIPSTTLEDASAQEASKQAILEYCRTKLPFSKAPKVVVFAEELPVTSTGKYQRNKVKHLFAAWKDAQFRK